MATLARLVLALLLVGATLALDRIGGLDSLDRTLVDARFALSSRTPSRDVVVVEIDSRSLAQVGVWPWPRSIHARLLDQLMALDARDVAFDVDFSTASDPGDDAAFAASLANAGGFAWLAALEQNGSADGAVQVNMPIPLFEANAEAVNVNVQLDRQGRVVSFPRAIDGPDGPLPSLAEALAGNTRPATGSAFIDYGIDLRQIDRISAADVLDGSVDPARIAGKQVIVGASAIELRDQFAAPRFGLVPGALVQAEALETVKAGRGMTAMGALPALAAVTLIALLAILGGWSSDLRRVGLLAGGTLVFIEAGAWLLQLELRVILDTAPADLATLLLAALSLAAALHEEYGRRRAAQRRLAYLARHDPVTDTLSREGLAELLEGRDDPVTILLAGIRRLDLVRGALGHDVADLTLARIARRLEALGIAQLALVDRDTFALAWDGPLGRDEIDQHCDRILRHLDQSIEASGHSVFVDAAFGSATGGGVEAVLRRAELALADGLRSGHPGLFTPALEARVVSRRRVDSALRSAIERHAIGVQFQPQVRLADGALVGVEALARWVDDELGPVSPGEFIPLAEETGLIVRLGELVLRDACRQAAAWDWDGRLAVNVSPAQIQLGEIVPIVESALAESSFPLARLDIEVTEGLLVDRRGQAATQLRALRARGIGLAIDDFGTGYSALSYLRELDCDKLKLDRSFLSDFTAGSAGAAVVRSMIELGHRLGKTIVVEGIEEEDQRLLLRSMGCDIGQGYLFGRAVSAADIAAMIDEQALAAANQAG